MEALALNELAARIKQALEALEVEYWVTAEVAQVNVNSRSGHCYLDLVEKDGDATLAQMRATIWKYQYKRVEARFKRATGSDLAAGMKVLLLVEVRFHEVFGLSLNVQDIDPSYTLGEMARKRRETIARLEKEGIIDRNKEMEMPTLPTRLAVVSSETAAGFGDFINTLKSGGYGFAVTLYPAFMQGDNAEPSIIKALTAIRGRSSEFDTVVLIRGGGSQVDLSCFDSYALAREIALFPLPVLAGIGHERDETVADMVAHLRLITPTAVAEHLVGLMEEFASAVHDLSRRLQLRAGALVQDARHQLRFLASSLLSGARGLLKDAGHSLALKARGLSSSSNALIERKLTALALAAGGFRHMAAGAVRAQRVRLDDIGHGLPRNTA
ncbi:MAG: exodeoxyribonuclease VII large subunit, partial [Thermodesulfovibrionales bacterium]|nr:exodeoxyribonuclease VII large subunit [Thermodesulfovibrionales bacterium]